jgi:hypothetical protein
MSYRLADEFQLFCYSSYKQCSIELQQ